MAGTIYNQYFCIVLDANSKSVEVFRISNLTSALVIVKVIETLARFGLLEVLFGDNGTHLVSKEFDFFLTSYGVEHITSPTFYPSSSGAPENSVTF